MLESLPGKRVASKIAVLLLVMVMAFGCSLLPDARRLTWSLTLEIDGQPDELEGVADQTIAIINRRLDLLYVPAHKVERQGNSRILVSLADVADRERLKKFITTTGKLELVHVVSPPSPYPVETYQTKEAAIASLGSTLPPNRRVLTYLDDQPNANQTEGVTSKPTKWVVVESPAVVTGNDLRSAEAVQLGPGRDDDFTVHDDFTVQFSLNASGAERFGAWTAANINQYLGVVFNDEVRSIAYLKSQIFDQGEITGSFTKESAEDLANVLISGALPAPVKIISEAPIK